jgi:hypothetical protein
LPLNYNHEKPADNQVAISWKRIILFHCPLDGEHITSGMILCFVESRFSRFRMKVKEVLVDR